MTLPAAIRPTTSAGAPAGATANPETGSSVAVGTGAGSDACAFTAVPPRVGLLGEYEVPPVPEADDVPAASARAGSTTINVASRNATTTRRDILLWSSAAFVALPLLVAAMHHITARN